MRVILGEVRLNKEDLSTALRELRQASGLTAKAVARSAVMSQSKLSKIENGHLAPSLTDVERILTALEVSEEVKAEFIKVARVAATEATAWRLYRRLGSHKKQLQIQAVEAQTAVIRLFQCSLIPGLLQTPEYVRAVLGRRNLTTDETTRTVGARLERQSVLYDSGKSFHFVITEPVLWWRILPAAMLASQLDRLVSISRLSNVRIGVVPLASRQTDFPGTPFCIFDERLVTVETPHAEVVTTEPRDIATYAAKFNGFAAVAIYDDEMRRHIERARDELLTGQETV
ncbi:helix-turn-helix domain-containing protein [Streptosporangium sp. V21-05]|uniref:helix-turn-helix domain-containing protein n=1 Tax=Streptosporangium sp. V21-05 TaxID=3446115 RepID=UPI003F52F84E